MNILDLRERFKNQEVTMTHFEKEMFNYSPDIGKYPDVVIFTSKQLGQLMHRYGETRWGMPDMFITICFQVQEDDTT